MSWKLHKRERYALIEQDEANPSVFRGTFHIGPRHVKHHSSKEFVEHAYVKNPDFASERNCRVFAQSSNIAVEVYDFYNKLFDPDYENVSVYDERFEVQYLFKEPDKWTTYVRGFDKKDVRVTIEPKPRKVSTRTQAQNNYLWGGVYPIIAEALADAGVDRGRIEAIAVTSQPGLIGSLLVAVMAGKTLAYAWDKPLIGVNHVHAHVYSAALDSEPIEYPAVALAVSVGHTALYHCNSPIEVT